MTGGYTDYSIKGVPHTSMAICAHLQTGDPDEKAWAWIRKERVLAVRPMSDGSALIYAGSEVFGTHPDSPASSVLEALGWQ